MTSRDYNYLRRGSANGGVIEPPPKVPGEVRITFRGPKIGELEEAAGKYQQQVFVGLPAARDWISLHIPQNELRLVSMWIEGKPITGSTLQACLRSTDGQLRSPT